MSHLYSPEGQLIEGADLRMARKLGLYFSPTTILHGTWNNEGLSFWKDSQLVEAVLSTPRFMDEEIKSYIARVKEKSFTKRDNASTFGSAVHDAIEHYGTGAFVDPKIQPYLDTYAVWYSENVRRVLAQEIVLIDKEIGVCGKCDLIYENNNGEICTADFKTQAVKPGDKPSVRQGFVEQLSFYAHTYHAMNGITDTPKCQNLLINSTEPSPIVVKDYSTKEIEEGYVRFRALTWTFYSSKGAAGYWPCGKWAI